MKSVLIRIFCSPYFPAFGLNTERYSVSLRIRSECGKMRTRKTPNTGTLRTDAGIYWPGKMPYFCVFDTVHFTSIPLNFRIFSVILGEKMEEVLGVMQVELDGRFSTVRTKESNLGSYQYFAYYDWFQNSELYRMIFKSTDNSLFISLD